ncbi:MAG: hypothetical protein KAJ33_02045 [Thermoplasmata archaeon]|nr:hypothetical protein [Thermoplasmata archaeon]MCK5397015.1 hypothetical protein [Thermoplasmata archaeon]
MVSQSDIQKLENIIVENAGPMGKFIIKKSMSDIGVEPEQITGATQVKFIDMVLERAIFDENKRVTIRREILSAWGGANV